MYEQSQYRMKNPKSIITDNVVYSHAGIEYFRGGNPTYINPEAPPLGKYIIGLSIEWFKNENIFNLLFCSASLIVLYLLSFQILRDKLMAIIPVTLFSSEKIFQGQIIDTPLLDIIQLTFLLLSFIFLNMGLEKKKTFIFFLTSSFFIGLFVSTKFFATGVLVVATFLLTVIINYRVKIKNLLFSLFLVPIVLLISYSRLFSLGYSLREVLGVQKWVFLYNSGHLDMPLLVVWDLMLFNRWHTWWGDKTIISDSVWIINWPILIIITLITILLFSNKYVKSKSLIVPVIIWVALYSVFLSFGHATSRYLLILLPFLYIVSVKGVIDFIQMLIKKKKTRFLTVFLVSFLAVIVLNVKPVFAQNSGYVLPYPGIMPGNKLYKLNTIIEELEKYFSFGDFSKFKYNLKQADKYLVEAKTLFEYGQYALAVQSLKKSDSYFNNLQPLLVMARKNNKDTSEKKVVLKLASQKHTELLTNLIKELPAEFTWQDEKKLPIRLLIRQELNNSIKVRAK